MTEAIGVEVLYSIISGERKGLFDHCSKVLEDGSYLLGLRLEIGLRERDS